MRTSTRSMPVPVRIFFNALIVAALLGALCMYIFDGLGPTPLQSLPLLFWVFLFSVPVLQWLSVLVWNTTPLGRDTANTTSLGLVLFPGCLGLVMAFLNNLLEPQWGGNAAIFLAAGCTSLANAYLVYRRSRVMI